MKVKTDSRHDVVLRVPLVVRRSKLVAPLAGLYLHIPFCTRRCIYCDFYVTTTRRLTRPFVDAMRIEIDAYGREYGGREAIETIYFGGGTPSLLPLDEVAMLMREIERHFDTSSAHEVTFEVNPETAGREYLEGLRDLGITRLSVGVQSFFDPDLQFMGRAHDGDEAMRAIEAIEAVGFDSYSVDLIFGVPEQPPERWMANMERAANLGVPHLSTYGLTVEEQTPLAKMVERGTVAPTPDTAMGERFLETMDYLRERGYEHYEISSFGQPGVRSRHNEIYWEHGNYLGFGPSAHSFWRETPSLAGRWANVRNLRQYEALMQQGHRPLDYQERLGADILADEYILLRLRLLRDGLDLDVLAETYGVDLLTEKIDALADLEAGGLIHPIRRSTVRLTDEGALVADAVTAKLLS
ncbi:MAG: radical SAM family heme chaperone HemW [Bacteroidota bacterium]